MLKLHRRAGQAIFFDYKGKAICVHVHRVYDDGSVSLRCGADQDVKIVRSEVVAKNLEVGKLPNDKLFELYQDSLEESV